jgi:hypothetical protein
MQKTITAATDAVTTEDSIVRADTLGTEQPTTMTHITAINARNTNISHIIAQRIPMKLTTAINARNTGIPFGTAQQTTTKDIITTNAQSIIILNDNNGNPRKPAKTNFKRSESSTRV